MAGEARPRRSLTIRTILSVVLSLGALLVGLAAFVGLASLKQPPAARDRIVKTYNVEVFSVEPTDLREIVSAFGTARADREVIIAAQVAGTIVETHPQLRVGQLIRAQRGSERLYGDLLVRIDPRTYAERVTQAERRIAEDEAELERLKQEQANNEVLLKQAEEDVQTYREEYDRIRGLAERGVATPNDVTKARLELQRYEAALLQRKNEQELFPLRIEQLRRRQTTTQSELQVAQLDLNRTEVRPPFDGIASEVMVEQGQYVRPGDPLVRLTQTGVVEIPVSLTLDDYARLGKRVADARETGDAPVVALAENETAEPRWKGRLVRVAPEANERTRTIWGYVIVENDAQPVPLLPGTFVNARIEGPLLENVTVVPRDAIIEERLFVANGNGTAERRKVNVARTLQTLAVVNSGVEPGDQVILTNLDVIYDGAQVEVQAKRGLRDEIRKQGVRVAVPAGIAKFGTGEPEAMN